MSNMDYYTKFIAEQTRKDGTSLSEATAQTAARKERKALHAALGGDTSTRADRGGSGTGVITSKSPDEVHKQLTDMGYEKTGTGSHGSRTTHKYSKPHEGVTHHVTVIGDFEKGKTGVQHYV